MSDVNLRIGIDSGPSRTGASEVRRSLDDIKRKAGDTTRSVDGVSGAFDRMRSTIFLVQGAIAALGLGLFVRDAIQASLALERINASLRVAAGSANGAARELAFVRGVANSLGLALQESATQYAKLAAAARGTNLQGQATREIFLGVANAAAALNLTSEQVSGALTAFEQIISKGTVSAEELRGQLGERLPGAFQLAARSIGVTTAELSKMLEQGQLTADRLLPALARELQNTFGGDAQRNADSLTARINRLNNAWFEFETTLANSILVDILTEGLRLATGLLDQINQTFRSDDNLSTGQAIREIADLQQRLKDSQEGGTDRLGYTTFELQTRLERLTELYPEAAVAANEFLASATTSTEALTTAQQKALDKIQDTTQALEIENGNLNRQAEVVGQARDRQDAFNVVLAAQAALLKAGISEGFDQVAQRLRDYDAATASATDRIAILGAANERLNQTLDRQTDLLDDIRSAEDDLAILEREAELIGAGRVERERSLAVLRETLRIKREYGSATSDEARRLIALNAEIAEQRAAMEIAQDSYDALADAGEQAFDRIGEAITQSLATGELEMVEFGNIWNAVVSEMVQTALRLGAINPILNSVFGGNRPTLSGALDATGQQGGGILDLPLGDVGGQIQDFLGLGSSAGPSAQQLALSGPLGGSGTLPGTATGSTGAAGVGAASGISLGQGLGAAGFGFNAFSNFQSGNIVGGIGNAAAAALMFTPAAPAAPFVAIGSQLLGGLFGNKKPTVGPNSQAAATLQGGLASLYNTGADNGGDLQRSVGLLSNLAQALNQVSQAAGRDVGAQQARISVMEKTGEITVEAAGQIGKFTDETEAILFGVKALSNGFAGFDDEMERVVTQADTLEQALADLATIAEIDSLRTSFAEASSMEQAIGELTQRYQDLTDAAERLNLSETRRQRILEAQARELDYLRSNFEQDIERQILAITNSGSAALAELQGEFVETLRNGAAVGADLVRIEELYGLRRLQAVQRFSDAQLRALEGGSRLDRSLAAYEQARREIDRALSEIEAPFNAFVSAAENFRDNLRGLIDGLLLDQTVSPLSPTERLAQARSAFDRDVAAARGGDTVALNRVATDLQAYLRENASYFGATAQGAENFNEAIRIAEELGVSLGGEIDVQQSQLDRLTEIRDLLANPSGVDLAALQAAIGAAGLGEQLGGLISQFGQAQAGANEEIGKSNRDALQEAYSQALDSARAGNAGSVSTFVNIARQLLDMGAISRTGVNQDAADIRERGFDVPTFAMGGLHRGGLRLVGEMGPELEFTGPSRLVSADRTAEMLRAGDSRPVVVALDRQTDVLDRRLASVDQRLEKVEGRLFAGERGRRVMGGQKR